MKFQTMTTAFALLTLVGCKNIFEDNDTTLDGSTPYTTVKSPSANNIYRASEPLNLATNFTDKDGFDVIDVKMVRLGSDLKTSASVVDFKKHPKVNPFNLDTTFAANTFAPGTYQLSIRSVDTRKNEGTTQVTFTVQ
jgi:hypothetical protein